MAATVGIAVIAMTVDRFLGSFSMDSFSPVIMVVVLTIAAVVAVLLATSGSRAF